MQERRRTRLGFGKTVIMCMQFAYIRFLTWLTLPLLLYLFHRFYFLFRNFFFKPSLLSNYSHCVHTLFRFRLFLFVSKSYECNRNSTLNALSSILLSICISNFLKWIKKTHTLKQSTAKTKKCIVHFGMRPLLSLQQMQYSLTHSNTHTHTHTNHTVDIGVLKLDII